MATYRILVIGKVQGVFYRATAKEVADNLGITGWVRNTEDGHVEIMASGKEESISKFMVWCRKGPEKAEVEDITAEKRNDANFKGFSIKRG